MIVIEGVLAGEAELFPLLYHWRVLPGRPPIASEPLDIDAVVAQFGGAPAVRIRFEELAGAVSSLVLFVEYVPDPLLDRLNDPVGKTETIEWQTRRWQGLLDLGSSIRAGDYYAPSGGRHGLSVLVWAILRNWREGWLECV